MLPHSREQELEADRIGLIYMARAGYDPREAVAFWQRFQAYSAQHGAAKPSPSSVPIRSTTCASSASARCCRRRWPSIGKQNSA